MSTTSYIKSQDYSDETVLGFKEARQELHGQRYSLYGADQKQLVLTSKDVVAKCCINKKQEVPFLSLDPSQNEQLVATLDKIRSRLIRDLKLAEDALPPIITPGTSTLLRNKPSSLILNMTDKTGLKDAQNQKVAYPTLEGKECKMSVYIHLQSVFKNKKNQYSFKYRVSHMVLKEVLEASILEAESYELDEPEPEVEVEDIQSQL